MGEPLSSQTSSSRAHSLLRVPLVLGGAAEGCAKRPEAEQTYAERPEEPEALADGRAKKKARPLRSGKGMGSEWPCEWSSWCGRTARQATSAVSSENSTLHWLPLDWKLRGPATSCDPAQPYMAILPPSPYPPKPPREKERHGWTMWISFCCPNAHVPTMKRWRPLSPPGIGTCTRT